MINVLVKQESSGRVSAMVLGLPEYQVESTDRVSALASLQKLLATSLESAEIISLEIEQNQPTHPWMKFAGMFKDDPNFDEMLEDIEEFRQEKNAELNILDRQLDAPE
ncbi:MAG: hypothetical protein ACFCU5_20080 [Pleurocapsa sp.]